MPYLASLSRSGSTTRTAPRGLLAGCILALAALTACPPPPPVDAGSDAAPDAAPDATNPPDAQPPPDTQPPPDATAEASVDAAPVDAAPVDAARDASADAPVDAPPGECNALDLGTAPDVVPTATGATLPLPTGGALPDGEYVLRRAAVYVAGHDGGPSPVPLPPARQVLAFRAGRLEAATQSGGSAVIRVSGTYATAGNMLTVTSTCPSPTSPSGLYYGVDAAGELTLLSRDGGGMTALYLTRR